MIRVGKHRGRTAAAAAAVAVALVLGCSGDRENTAASDLPPGFTAVDIPPFRVLGDEPPDVVTSRARSLETAAQLLRADLFEKDPAPGLDVWLFRDAESTLRHTRQLFGRDPDPPAGFYSVADHAIVVDVSAGDGAPVHFLVHTFTTANLPSCPVWFDEGLAALYEARAEGQTSVTSIAADPLPSLEGLTALDPAGFHGRGREVHRRMAHHLCHHLQQEGLLGGFYRALHELDADDPGGYRALVRIAGGDDPALLQRRWEQHVLASPEGD